MSQHIGKKGKPLTLKPRKKPTRQQIIRAQNRRKLSMFDVRKHDGSEVEVGD